MAKRYSKGDKLTATDLNRIEERIGTNPALSFTHTSAVNGTPTSYRREIRDEPLEYRFRPTRSLNSQVTVDISEGSWIVESTGASVTLTDGEQDLGDKDNTFVVVEVNDASNPTTITAAAQSTAPTADEYGTKRLITELTYNGNDKLTNIERYQLGDIIVAGVDTLYHRFRPIISSDSLTVSITTGGWSRNGIYNATSVTTTGLCTESRPYVIATIDDPHNPASLTVSDYDIHPALWDADLWDTTRLLCYCTYTDGLISKVTRYTVGDISPDRRRAVVKRWYDEDNATYTEQSTMPVGELTAGAYYRLEITEEPYQLINNYYQQCIPQE